jgi:uncharacterized membrane protein YfcA
MAMPVLLVVALAGFVASLVDGSLGMGFGLTSATFLLAAGVAPAAVSGTVNIAKVATGLASGAAHWRYGNVDRRLLLLLAAPGALGAIVGVTLLANVDGDSLKPWLAVFLLGLGVRLLLKFSRTDAAAPAPPHPAKRRHGIVGWAFLAGITNGVIGAWGPVITPALLGRDDIEPRTAVGTANAAEVVVALTSVASVFAALGGSGVDVGIIAAILLGGVLAAPLAARLVRHLQPRLLGVAIGGFLLLTNAKELVDDLDAAYWWLSGLAIVAVTLLAWFRPRLTRGSESVDLPVPAPTGADTRPAV